MKRKLMTNLAAGATIAAAMLPLAALAQLPQPTVPIGGGDAVTASTLENLINQIAQFLITISIVIAVIFIIWGGLQYVRGKADEGRKILTNAAIGVAIILGVGLILQTISRLVLTQSIG